MNRTISYASFQLTLCLSFTVLLSCSVTKNQTYSSSGDNYWTKEKREEYLKNREDPNTWDKQMFEEDMEWVDDLPSGPFHEGVFPETKYDIHGKFTGIGNKAGKYQVGEKTVLMNSFFSNKNEINQQFLDTLSNEVFFHIVVLTDTIDTVNYNHLSSIIISRNHPDYLGQGFFKTKTTQLDYTAFVTAERENFAIVNTRLFNLKYGRTILVAPQKDKSLRTLQIKSPKISSRTVEEYTQRLLEKQSVVNFFLDGNGI